VATLQHKGSPNFEEDEGVRIYRLTGLNRMLAPLYQDQEHQFHLPLPDPEVMAGLRRVVEQERPDIVHARRWMMYSFIGLKAWSKAKLVVTLHDYSLFCSTMTYFHDGRTCTGPNYAKCICCASNHYGTGKALLLTSGLKLSSYMNKYVDQYIAVSSAVRDASMIGTGQPSRPIEVIPTFIPDTAVSEPSCLDWPSFLPPQDNYILFVGRQGAYKGLDVLLEAYAGLSDVAPLVIMVSEYSESSRSLPPGVTLVRNVPHAQVMVGWQHCAVGVVPSIWPEPFAQVAIEAMACGKPVVASAVGGFPDMIVDGESGLIVPPGDVHALRKALRELLLDPVRRVRMGEAACQRATMFTVGTVVVQIERMYTKLLATSNK